MKDSRKEICKEGVRQWGKKSKEKTRVKNHKEVEKKGAHMKDERDRIS